MRQIETCYHPELRPTGWNQPRPEPCKMTSCGCGQNQCCHVCGWGFGAMPCDCHKKNLQELRNDVVLSGHKLSTPEEIDAEISEMRHHDYGFGTHIQEAVDIIKNW